MNDFKISLTIPILEDEGAAFNSDKTSSLTKDRLVSILTKVEKAQDCNVVCGMIILDVSSFVKDDRSSR